MAQGNLTIHTENILPIIKKWLYSDKDIFVRELISNACDALAKLKILRDAKEVAVKDEELRIDLKIDKTNRTLQFTDTGIGMTADEVEKYITQLAFSGAEEFLGKYKTHEEKDQIIGHFGLGFYSAYMVAENVEIRTLSYRPGAEPVFWSCDGSTTYTIETGDKTERGTEITLFLDKENEEFLEESRVRQILEHYCSFLPFPIYLNGNHINPKEPLWVKPAAACTEKDYLDFYHQLYPFEPDPIFWVHLSVDYPFHLKGILYFPKIGDRLDLSKNTVKLFSNRVFVSDNCKDLMPEFLTILRGAIDSPDIPLNVSRSYLQMDRTVRQLATHISKKVADRVMALYLRDKEKFLSTWKDSEVIIKLGMLQDEKFYERTKEVLVWKNLQGEWVSLDEYIQKHKEEYSDKVFYTQTEKQAAHFLDLYKDKGIEVLYTSSYIDTALMNFLEGKLKPLKFQRVDGAIDPTILDPSREKSVLNAEGKSESSEIADYVRDTLGEEKLSVEAKSLASDHVPAFIVIDEETRRLRDYMALSQASFPAELFNKRTFVINTNSKLVSSIYGLKEKDPDLAKEMLRQLYELSLLSQRELTPEDLTAFVQRSHQVLEKLTSSKNT